ncbi:sensor histidine kinase [Actinoplanes palleronii]|uniref:sensor histidine kinase n=1 Tax=Actinoplanes palleronii TaxID=113570 RepID=UPI0031D6554D
MDQRTFLAARADRWFRARPVRLDLLLTALTWLVLGLPGAALAGVTGLLVATVTIAPLVLRRRFPVVVLCWSAAAFAGQLLLVPIPLPANAAQAIVVYTVAAHVGSPVVRMLALALAVTGCLAGGLRWSTPPDQTRNALVIGVTLAVCSVLIAVIGELVRGGRANVRELHEARRQRDRLTEQRRRMLAAAEIHDIVAHSLTVVIVQADAGGYAAGTTPSWRPADAGAVLNTIAGAARTALAEVRGVITMLHEPDAAEEPPGDAVHRDDLRRLVDAVRAAGLPVVVTGPPAWFDEVPAAVRLAVFRTVREALTNVLKHAGRDATARLTVERHGDAVRATVEDDGRGPDATPPPGRSVPGSELTGPDHGPAAPGHGLAGLRERLGALDGVLETGPAPDRGFRVSLTLPGVFGPDPGWSSGVPRDLRGTPESQPGGGDR